MNSLQSKLVASNTSQYCLAANISAIYLYTVVAECTLFPYACLQERAGVLKEGRGGAERAELEDSLNCSRG